jgi:subtilisin-like proprotein convertase family protein
MISMLRTGIALLTLACGASLWAQGIPMVEPIRAGLDGDVVFAGGQPLEIDVDLLSSLPAEGEFIFAAVPLGEDEAVDLIVERLADPSRGSLVYVTQADGTIDAFPAPGGDYFTGAVLGEADSRFFLSVNEAGVHGWLFRGESRLIVTTGDPLDPHAPALFDLSSEAIAAMDWADFACGTNAEAQRIDGDEGGIAMLVMCKEIEIATDTDDEYVARFTSQGQAAAYATTLTAALNSIYKIELGLRARNIGTYMYAVDPWTTNIAPSQLDQLKSYWNANRSTVQRDAVHLLSGRSFTDANGVGVGGMAMGIGHLCNASAYAFSGQIGGSFPSPLVRGPGNWDPVVYMHEIGHLVGGVHTHQLNPPYDQCAAPWNVCGNAANIGTIMSYCHGCPGGIANINLVFAAPNRAQIGTYVNPLTCLAPIDCDGSGDCILGLTPQVFQPLADLEDNNMWGITINAVDSTCVWQIANVPAWIEILTPVSLRKGSGTLVFRISDNTSVEERYGDFLVGPFTIWIVQAGAPCALTLSPTSQSFAAQGGAGSFTANWNGPLCPWVAVASASPWITVAPGSSSGTGTATVQFTVAPNPGTTARTGAVTVRHTDFWPTQSFSITQAGSAPCTYALASSTASVPAAAGSGTVALTASASTCAWTATSNQSWIAPSPGSGSGTGSATVAYAYSANTATTARSATLTIAGKTLTVTQAAAPPCEFSLPTNAVNVSSAGGAATASIVANGAHCLWQATTSTPWITLTAGSGSGSGTLQFTCAANTGLNARVGTISVIGQTVTVSQAGTGNGAWTPAVLAGLRAWFKADAIPASDRASDLVSRWIDSETALGDESVASSGTARPLYVANAQAGRPVVRFDGANDALTRGASPLLRQVNGATVFAVRRFASVPTSARTAVFISNGVAAGGERMSLRGSSTGLPQALARNLDANASSIAAGAAAVPTTFQLHGVVADFAGGSVAQWIDGVAAGTATMTAAASSATNSLAASLGSANVANTYFAGDLAEVVIYHGALSNSDRQKLEGYLAHRWGTASSLPASHPYRNAPPGTLNCTYTLSIEVQSAPATSGTGSVALATTEPYCPWTATSSASWLTVAGGSASGVGGATIGYSFAANTTASPRTATITIAGRTLVVTQQAPAAGLPWQPSSLASLAAWFKADAIPAGDRATDRVTRWINSASAGATGNFTASGSPRPTYVASGLNGKPVVRFDGADDALTLGSSTLLKQVPGATVYAVRKFATVPTSQRSFFFVSTGSSGTSTRFVMRTSSTAQPQVVGRRLDSGTISSATSTAPVPQAFEIHGGVANYSGGSISQWINGLAQGTATVSAGTTSASNALGSAIGSAKASGTHFSGDIGEIVVVHAALGAADREKLEGYLAHRWGLATSLPTSHPFRTTPPTEAPCGFTLGSAARTVPATASSGTVALTASSPSCAWTASSSASWLTLASASTSGTGSAVISFSVAANTVPTARVATITIAGMSHVVTQAAVVPCTYALASSTAAVPATAGSGTVALTASASNCAWTATSNQSWLTVSSGSASGSGSATIAYSYAANTGSSARVATITVAGQTLAVTQAAAFNLFTVDLAGGAIPDAVGTTPGVLERTFSVPSGALQGVLSAVRVTATSLTHTWCGDLTIELVAPDGTVSSVVTRIGIPASTDGDSSNFGGTYAFDDAFTGNIWNAAAGVGANGVVPAGNRFPSAAGSGARANIVPQLVGRPLAGSWTLRVRDSVAADVGSVGSLQVRITSIP